MGIRRATSIQYIFHIWLRCCILCSCVFVCNFSTELKSSFHFYSEKTFNYRFAIPETISKFAETLYSYFQWNMRPTSKWLEISFFIAYPHDFHELLWHDDSVLCQRDNNIFMRKLVVFFCFYCALFWYVTAVSYNDNKLDDEFVSSQ